jgi:hypothetical protein
LYKLGNKGVLLPIETVDKIPFTKDSGRFVSGLMCCLLTRDEMKNMSLTGGYCAANKYTYVCKEAVPEDIVDAIVCRFKNINMKNYLLILVLPLLYTDTTKQKYNVSREDILKKITCKLANESRKQKEPET